jgi:hypothetical protein
MKQNTATAVFIGLMLLWTIDLSGQTLSVTMLATGSPIPIVDRFGPSTLIQAGAETLLFDCGRGVPLRLWAVARPVAQRDRCLFHTLAFRSCSWLSGLLADRLVATTIRTSNGETACLRTHWNREYDETPSEGV